MKVDLYAVYDVCSGVYDGPIPGRADGEMIRNFSFMCVNSESKISQSPADYTLFKIGTWDDGKGIVEGITPKKLINGAEAVSASRQIEQGSLKQEEFEKTINGNNNLAFTEHR